MKAKTPKPVSARRFHEVERDLAFSRDTNQKLLKVAQDRYKQGKDDATAEIFAARVKGALLAYLLELESKCRKQVQHEEDVAMGVGIEHPTSADIHQAVAEKVHAIIEQIHGGHVRKIN